MAEPPGPPEPPAAAPDLAAVFKDLRPQLLRMAERICARATDAEDLVQDTFERAVRGRIPPDVRNVHAWLTTSFHNLFLDHLRKRARSPSHETMNEQHHGVTEIEADGPEPRWSQLTSEDIRAALDALEPIYREVYVLHTVEHRSYQDIADQLGIQRVTVGTRLNRARRKLREILVARFGLEAP